MLKTRRSRDRLIFNMVIPIIGKYGLYIEIGPRWCHVGLYLNNITHFHCWSNGYHLKTEFGILYISSTLPPNYWGFETMDTKYYTSRIKSVKKRFQWKLEHINFVWRVPRFKQTCDYATMQTAWDNGLDRYLYPYCLWNDITHQYPNFNVSVPKPLFGSSGINV